MTDWRHEAEITSDVVFFRYENSGKESEAQEIYVWDLDKTYLDTRFQSLRDLWKTIIERAFQKKNVPGTSSLVRALQDFWQQETSDTHLPIFFITASPPQLERKIFEKLEIDGIQPFGAFFKDNLKNLTPKRFWRLNKQVGYKIQSLMQLRLKLREDVRQVLWGDDSESDAIIYNLYSDICSRRRSRGELKKILKHLSVSSDQIDTILQLQSGVPKMDPVDKIYINLADDTDPEYYLKFGRRTVATTSTLQIAFDLYQDRRLSATQLVRIAQDMLHNYAFTVEEFDLALDQLVRRKILADTSCTEIVELFKNYALLSPFFVPSVEPRKISVRKEGRVYELDGVFEPWVPDKIDYFHDYR